jgi:hypothetical protein
LYLLSRIIACFFIFSDYLGKDVVAVQIKLKILRFEADDLDEGGIYTSG